MPLTFSSFLVLSEIYTFVLFFHLHVCTSSTSIVMQAVVYKPGGVENLSVQEVEKPSIEDKDYHVLIKIHYFAINRADTLQRKGLYPPPKGESEILGLEAAGVIEEVGKKCNKKWRYWVTIGIMYNLNNNN